MNIILVGLNHRTTPVEVRERMAFPKEQLVDATRALCDGVVLREATILSTCNRVELYGATEDAAAGLSAMKSFLSRYRGLEQSHAPKFYEQVDPESVRHIFEVACGLDSMVLGETEILGQVKESYEAARRAGAVGKVLHRLFQKTFQVAKHVRTRTRIGQGSVSVGSIAVKLAEKIFGGLADKTVMILGAGEAAETVARRLKECGAGAVVVASRSTERAQRLAAKLEGRAIPFEMWENDLPAVDIVISAAAVPQAVLTREKLASPMKLRRGRPLFLIDIGVPRNIERSVNTLDGVFLYDIDDLQAVARENLKARELEVSLCCSIIEHKTRQFEAWLAAYRLATNLRTGG